MNFLFSQNSKIDIISKVLLFLVMIFFFGYLFAGEILLPSERLISTEDCKRLNLAWTWEKSDGTTEHISLPGDYDVKRNEPMVITAKLPNINEHDCLMFWDKGSDMKVYIDDALRYEFSTDNSRWLGLVCSYTYQFIELAPNDSGKEIRFELLCNSVSAGNLGELYIGDKSSEMLTAIKPFQFQILASIVLLILGVFCVILDILISIKTKIKTQIMYLGFGVSLVALWILMNMQPRQFLFSNASVVRDCAFFASAIMLMPFLIYMDNIQDKRFHKTYFLMNIAFAINFIVLVTRYIIHERILFNPSMCCMSMAFLIFAITLFWDFFTGRMKKYKTIAFGLLVMLGFGVLQFLYYVYFPHYTYGGILVILGLVTLTITAVITSARYLFEVHVKKNAADKKLESLTVQAMKSLALVVDAKDKYTSGHCERVSKYSVMIAKRLGWPEDRQQHIKYVALLHDVGKIGVPDTIINKTDKLTDEEYDIIKTHPKIGAEILSQIKEIPDIAIGARWHHERYDGKGYPDQLAGTDIPKLARIIAVADAYDAMTSNRSYRKYLPQDVVRAEIVKNIGIQFDPKYGRIMLEIIDDDLDYELHE